MLGLGLIKSILISGGIEVLKVVLVSLAAHRILAFIITILLYALNNKHISYLDLDRVNCIGRLDLFLCH